MDLFPDPSFSLEELQRFFDLSFALEEAILKRQQEILEERRRRNNRSKKRKARRRRDNATSYQMLMADYFDENCRFTEVQFRRRFRMKKSLFMRIVEGLSNYDNYFIRKRNKDGKLGLRSIQKCVAAMDMLVCGISADASDEYVKIGKSTALECTLKFCKGVIALFQDEYLRRPNMEDLQRLLKVGQERGFPGMIGSIDCMNWEWKNCLKA